MMKTLHCVCLVTFAIILSTSLGWAQVSAGFGDMQAFTTATQNQGPPPAPGTKITMQNWQQYKAFMPFGLMKLFEGSLFWKMPADVEIDIGPTIMGNIPKTFISATEKYSSQVKIVMLPNGHRRIDNYHGGVVFPNPQDPDKAFKILANSFFSYIPAVMAADEDNYPMIWLEDQHGDTTTETVAYVYRQTDWNTDPGYPVQENYAPGTWYTEWVEQLTPEEARYTASLQLYYKDQEEYPYPDAYVFVPALRRSLRLSSSARCSPEFGTDWTYDDAKFQGFNGGTAIFDADYLGDRKIMALLHYNNASTPAFPGDWFMPLGFPKPVWGQWELRDSSIIDTRRIPSMAAGYCYSHRIIYVDKETWNASWMDLYDSSAKLWKMLRYSDRMLDESDSGLGTTIGGITSAAWDVQNDHASLYLDVANPLKRGPYVNKQVPSEYLDGAKYGTPGGLMMILR